MSIENQTLVHFRHFRHFSSLLTIFPSTLVESALQITPFFTNKPNFRKSQMNVTNLLTREYDKMDTWSSGKNKPNSNPIQSQYKPKQTQCLPATPFGRACPPSVWRHKGKKICLGGLKNIDNYYYG